MKTLNKLIVIIFLFSVIISLNLTTDINAQEIDSTETEVIINKMRLPISPSKDTKTTYHSLEDEVAILIFDALEELRLYDIIVGINIDSTLEIQDSTITDDMILNIKDIDDFTEAIVITGIDFYQTGVPPKKEEDYFSINGPMQGLFDNNSEKSDKAYPNNIQTELIVYAQIIDIETGEFIVPFELDAIYVGGSRQKSKSKVMKQLKNKAIYELKWLYWLASEVISQKDQMRVLPIGTELGVRPEMIFEIIEPDRIMTIDDEEFIIPGGTAALASVVDTSIESSGLRIFRQWRDDYAGSWAVEHPSSIHALQLNYVPPSAESFTSFGIQFHARPLKIIDWGLEAQIINIIDSYEDRDWGFGFGGFGIFRFLNMSKLDLGAKLGIDLDIPFRDDDDGQTVHTALFSAHIGFAAEFLLSAKSDLVINAGYRFANKTDDWEYSEDDETFDAYWEDEAPEVDNSGFMLSVGIKLLFF